MRPIRHCQPTGPRLARPDDGLREGPVCRAPRGGTKISFPSYISDIYLRGLGLRGIFLLGSQMQVELEPKRREESARSAAPAPMTSRKTKAREMAKWVYTF